MNKVILFQGGVETLEYFAKRIGRYCEGQGKSVFYFDLKKPADSAKRVRKFIKAGETVLITFNFQGLSKEDCIYSERKGYIWQEYGIKCINIAVDHPYYYDNQLKNLPDDYIHISIDRLHEKYFREYYPEFKSGGFMPLAGSRLSETEIKKMSDRKTDILFAGNYTTPEFCKKYAGMIDEDYEKFYQGIMDELLDHPERTVEEVAVKHTERELGAVAYEDMRKVLNKMVFIDLYVRNYFRGMAVKSLAEAGLKVHVIGKDWDKLECSRMENIIMTGFSDSRTCMEAMADAKIAINVMPWFKDGAHDRVFNAVLNGAVSVSDVSVYQKEALGEGEGVVYYRLQEIEKLPCKVRELLDNEEKMNEIAERGYEKAAKEHTWEMRAKWLADRFF